MEAASAAAPAWPVAVRWVVRKRALASTLAVLAFAVVCGCCGIGPRRLAWADPWAWCGGALLLLGGGLRSWAAGTLHKSTLLTTTGPYAVVRNPLYLGSLLLALGCCCWCAVPSVPLAALSPLALVYVLRVQKEERSLAERHGEAWRVYAARTPRLFSTRWRGDFRDWRWAQWVRNHEYRAAAAIGLAWGAALLWSLGPG